MLNLEIGSLNEIDGRTSILTKTGLRGHAIPDNMHFSSVESSVRSTSAGTLAWWR